MRYAKKYHCVLIIGDARFSEALLSIKFVQADFEHYANKEIGILRTLDILNLFERRQRSHMLQYTTIQS